METSRTTRSGRQEWNSRSPVATIRRVPDRDVGAFEESADQASNIGVVVDDEHTEIAHTYFILWPSELQAVPVESARVATILIVDPDPATRSLLEVLVLRLGHRPIGQWELAEDETPDLMLLEPASRAGMQHAQRLRRRFPELRSSA